MKHAPSKVFDPKGISAENGTLKSIVNLTGNLLEQTRPLMITRNAGETIMEKRIGDRRLNVQAVPVIIPIG
jgi:hypothetical protein